MMDAEQVTEGCCEEHFPSEAMTAEERAEHVCPNCGWSPEDDLAEALGGE